MPSGRVSVVAISRGASIDGTVAADGVDGVDGVKLDALRILLTPFDDFSDGGDDSSDDFVDVKMPFLMMASPPLTSIDAAFDDGRRHLLESSCWTV